jgi:hypothetical protein
MPLIDLQTNLRDLQFGRDRVAGGNSNQPYVRSTIPAPDDESGTLGYLNQDFILRGGLNAVTNSIRDVERLGRYFLDIRNPSGLLFIAKQNLLSRTAVKTQASGLLNEGIYTPLGTLAQAGGVAFGLHTNKQGLNPFGGLETYSEVVDYNQSVYENRLTDLWVNKIENKNEDTKLLSYGGGPNSILGIGRTRINFADQRTGVNNIKLKNSRFFEGFSDEYQTKNQDYSVFTHPDFTNSTFSLNGRTLLGASPLALITIDENGFNIDGGINSFTRQIGNLYVSNNVSNDFNYAISLEPKAKKYVTRPYEVNKLLGGVTYIANNFYPNLPILFPPFQSNGHLNILNRTIGDLYSTNNVASDNLYAISLEPIAKKDINFNETKIGTPNFDFYIPRLKLIDSIFNPYADSAEAKTRISKPSLYDPNALGYSIRFAYSSWASQLLYNLYTPGTPSIIFHPSSINSSIRIGEYGLEQDFENNYFIPKTFTVNPAFEKQKGWTTLHPITNYSSFFQASTAYQTQTINGNQKSSTNPNIDLNLTFTTIDKESTGFGQGLTRTYTQEDINIINESHSGNIGDLTERVGGGGSTTTVKDFRESIRKKFTSAEVDRLDSVGNLAKSRNYDGGRIEKKFGDPGDRTGKNISNYVVGDYSSGGSTPLGAASPLSYDKVTWSPLYQDINATEIKADKADLIPFRIGVIDNDAPSKKTYIHFRAFLDSISDSYKAEWKGERYVGRGESFYTYGGFDRTVSLSWTVAAQSKAELMPMYKKLNFLASVCAPDYGESGYMRGNIVTLTIGGYFFEQPGIINGFTYEMNEDKDTWEIAIGIDDDDKDDNVVQVPHIIRVKSFQFTPIHTFVPRLQQNTFDGIGGKETDGKEHFIALEDDNTFGWKSDLL